MKLPCISVPVRRRAPAPSRIARTAGSVLASVRIPALAVVLAAAPVLAVTVTLAPSAAAGVTVHTPEEILADWTIREGDALFFRGPGGRHWELVTRIDDPLIANQGLGAFFPFEAASVRSALDALSFTMDAVDVEIFILPYPRRELLPSSAEGTAIVLSPGVAPLAENRVHAVVAHELGHVVHNRLLPDGNHDAWDVYRSLRGIEDVTVYHAGAAHRDRPHEIFAEDFRFLFGGDLANYSGTIENPDLPLPAGDHQLVAFFRDLALDLHRTGNGMGARLLRVFPNPARAGASIAFSPDAPSTEGAPFLPGVSILDGAHSPEGTPFTDAALTMEIHDARGRLLDRSSHDGATVLIWDGRSAAGTPVRAGLYFVRVRRGSTTWTGKLLITP